MREHLSYLESRIVGANMRAARHKRHMSQFALAEKLHTTQSTINNLEHGNIRFNDRWLTAVAAALGYSVETLRGHEVVEVEYEQADDYRESDP